MVDGFIKLMAAPDTINGPVNLGNPSEFSIRELAEMTIELTGSKSAVVYRPLPQDDPPQRQPDISKARHVLGWQPTVELREGLMRTIDYFDALLSKQVPS